MGKSSVVLFASSLNEDSPSGGVAAAIGIARGLLRRGVSLRAVAPGCPADIPSYPRGHLLDPAEVVRRAAPDAVLVVGRGDVWAAVASLGVPVGWVVTGRPEVRLIDDAQRRYPGIVAVYPSHAQRREQAVPGPAVVVHPPAITCDAIPLAGREIIVPSAEDAKGIALALEVLRRLALRGLILGARGPRPEQLPPGVVFESHLPRRAWLGRARLVLSPTRDETYGLALREAAEAGIPVVCSDLPALREALGPAARYVPAAAPAAVWEVAVRDVLAGPPPARPPAWDHEAELDGLLSALTDRPRDSAPAVLPASPPAAWPGDGKLHIGCGTRRLSGWVNADIHGGDVRMDVRRVEGRWAEIYASHVLEHILPGETPGALRSCHDALVPGGILRVAVPDVRAVVRCCLDTSEYGGERAWDSALSVIYGGGPGPDDPPHARHRQIFWLERLEQLLRDAGFADIRPWEPREVPEIAASHDYASAPISLRLLGRKPGGAPGPDPGPRLVLSVLVPSIDRPDYLRRCIEAIRRSCTRTPEVVVALAEGDEETASWLKGQPDVVVVDGGRGGAIDAVNRAYEVSRGRYVAWLNDDAEPLGSALDDAIRYLEDHPDVGAVAFARDLGDGPRLDRMWGQAHPCFGLARREVCERVIEHIGALWGDRQHRAHHTYGGDSLFAAVCHHLSIPIHGLETAVVRDHLAQDAIRARNRPPPDHGARWADLAAPFRVAVAAEDDWPGLPRPGTRQRRGGGSCCAHLRDV